MVNVMKKKLSVLCSVMLVLSICVAMLGTTNTMENDVVTATVKNYYAQKNETTTSSGLGGLVGDVVGGISGGSSGDIGEIIGGIGGESSGGIGDAIGGIGDSLGGVGDALGGIGEGFGGILGGLGGNSSPTIVNTTAPATTAADIGLIIPVPAATQTPSETAEASTSTSDESSTESVTVDFEATSNPYKKPTETYSVGDEAEGIKWIQWIFIYTRYGLKADGITGVLDDDTVAAVKKLQKENKLTVDGNITEDVIKAAEVLYYQKILGGNTSAIEVSSETTTGESAANQLNDTEKENDIPVALLVVVLVIIWILAIGGIVLLFLFKKKKMNVTKQEGTDAKETNKNEIGSLSDLFEEAENKDK